MPTRVCLRASSRRDLACRRVLVLVVDSGSQGAGAWFHGPDCRVPRRQHHRTPPRASPVQPPLYTLQGCLHGCETHRWLCCGGLARGLSCLWFACSSVLLGVLRCSERVLLVRLRETDPRVRRQCACPRHKPVAAVSRRAHAPASGVHSDGLRWRALQRRMLSVPAGGCGLFMERKRGSEL